MSRFAESMGCDRTQSVIASAMSFGPQDCVEASVGCARSVRDPGLPEGFEQAA